MAQSAEPSDVPESGETPRDDPRAARRKAATTMLGVGYGLGVPGAVGSPWIIPRRHLPAFAALMTGQGLIVAGWAVFPSRGRRRMRGLVLNALGLVGYAAWWQRAGRRRSRLPWRR